MHECRNVIYINVDMNVGMCACVGVMYLCTHIYVMDLALMAEVVRGV